MTCMDCEHTLSLDRKLGLVRCPWHGVPMALVSGHPLWAGERVQLVRPALLNRDRAVIQFPRGKRRTIRRAQLVPRGMEIAPLLRAQADARARPGGTP